MMSQKSKTLKRACKTLPTLHLALSDELIDQTPAKLIKAALPRATRTFPTMSFEMDSDAATRIPESIRKLFLVIKTVRDSLHEEFCLDRPKSILTKARELQRNINDWSNWVANPNNTEDFVLHHDRIENECLEPLRRVILETERDLSPLATVGSTSHELAILHGKAMLVCTTNALMALRSLFADMPDLVECIEITMTQPANGC